MTPGSPAWLASVREAAIDPERVIVDPHHHLWPPGGFLDYGIDDLVADTCSGHRIVQSVFVECGAAYRTEGPAHLRPVGETEFVVASAEQLRVRYPSAPPIAGIVAHADLTDPQLDDVLEAHEEAGGRLVRGIRDALARSLEPDAHRIPARNPEHKSSDPRFRAGVARLGERGLTYDSWHFHYQIRDFADLARAVPGTTMVLDHFGTPVGVGRFAGRHDEVFEQWRHDIAGVASCPNTVVKLGGLAMPDNGFGFDTAPLPPTSDELVDAQRRWYEYAIECFGPHRCMFESNFPVDRWSLSYGVYWNAMKKLAAQYSETEQDALFAGTARRVYGLVASDAVS